MTSLSHTAPAEEDVGQDRVFSRTDLQASSGEAVGEIPASTSSTIPSVILPESKEAAIALKATYEGDGTALDPSSSETTSSTSAPDAEAKTIGGGVWGSLSYLWHLPMAAIDSARGVGGARDKAVISSEGGDSGALPESSQRNGRILASAEDERAFLKSGGGLEGTSKTGGGWWSAAVAGLVPGWWGGGDESRREKASGEAAEGTLRTEPSKSNKPPSSNQETDDSSSSSSTSWWAWIFPSSPPGKESDSR